MWKIVLHDRQNIVIWAPGIIQVYERVDRYKSKHFTVQYIEHYLTDKDWGTKP